MDPLVSDVDRAPRGIKANWRYSRKVNVGRYRHSPLYDATGLTPTTRSQRQLAKGARGRIRRLYVQSTPPYLNP